MTWTGLKAIDSFGFISFINFGLHFFQLLQIGYFLEKLLYWFQFWPQSPTIYTDLELVKGQHMF